MPSSSARAFWTPPFENLWSYTSVTLPLFALSSSAG
jgi:hypothetical protein